MGLRGAGGRAGKLDRVRDCSAWSRAALFAERGADYGSYEGWQGIDAAERGAGEPLGRPRVKLHRWEKLLETGLKKITR